MVFIQFKDTIDKRGNKGANIHYNCELHYNYTAYNVTRDIYLRRWQHVANLHLTPQESCQVRVGEYPTVSLSLSILPTLM